MRARIKTERGNPVFGQHGDFAARKIDRAQAFHDVFFHFVALFNGERRRGDMDADALRAVAQICQA